MRAKLLISFSIIVFVAVTSVVFFARQGAAGEVYAYMFRGGMSGVESLVTQLEEYYSSTGGWAGVQELLVTNISQGHRAGQGMGPGGGMGQGIGQGGAMMSQRLRLADIQGDLVADTDAQAPAGRLTPEELDRSILLASGGQTIGYLLPDGGMLFNRGDELLLVNRITRAAITAGLVSGGLSLLLALGIAYGLLRPVGELTRAAQAMEKGNLTVRVPARGGDELGVLGRAFNRMAGSLQQAEESRKAITADIAHELRNPLAVQRANLEALQDGIYPLNPENLVPILEQNHLLTRLVEDLRTLALADAGQLALVRTPTQLYPLAQRIAARYQTQAAQRDIRITIEPPPEPLPDLDLDPMRIEQILSNLLSNSLRHTPASGAIRVSLARAGGRVTLTVHDNGPGIPQEALPNVFERFYRADRSRSRSEGGTGLGLTIARQLARAHGGDLTAANHPHGGAQFTLTL